MNAYELGGGLEEPWAEHGLFVGDDHPLKNARLVSRELFPEPITVTGEGGELGEGFRPFGWYAGIGYARLREEHEDMPIQFPKTSSLELLQRVVDDAEQSGDGSGPSLEISSSLLDEIKDALEAYTASNSVLTPQRMTQMVQQTDALFTAIRDIVMIEPAIRTANGRANQWYACAYCGSRHPRQPLLHRAGCAWLALKEAWEKLSPNQPAQGGG